MSNKARFIPFYPVFFLIYLSLTNEGISLRGFHIFFIFILRYILFEPFRWLEIILFEIKINKHQISADPIFIIGHWRSGTTRLQHLMSLDEKHTTTNVFHFLFIDNFMITERWLKPFLNWLCRIFKISYSFQRIPMDLNLPGELESAMTSICSPFSYTWGHIFPKRHTHWIKRMIQLENQNDIDGWLNDYDYLIKKMSFSSGGKRVIVKSPGDTGRIKHLKERYPNAKFIYLKRDPIDVYHSTQYFWGVINKEISFHHLKEQTIHSHIISTYTAVVSNYWAVRNEFNKDQLIEINFQDLNKNPLDTLKTIYETLQIGYFPEAKLTSFVRAKTTHKLGQYHTTKELALELRNAWGDIAHFQ